MRSKWIRYSSSSAERSPFWARSTSLRMWSVDSRAGFSVAPELTGSPFPGLACSEPDTAGALETPEIRDLRDDDVVGPILRLEHHDARPVLVERPLELVGRRAVHEAGDHLAAVEADLYPYALAVRHATPPPRELRGPIPDGRRRPGTRTSPGAARRRSARRPAAQDPRALRGDRRPRRRRDACRGHGWRENAPPASRRRAARAAPRDRPRPASTLPRRPVPRRAPGTRAGLRTGARTSAPPRRDPRRRRRRGGFRVPPPGRCYRRWVEWGCGSLLRRALRRHDDLRHADRLGRPRLRFDAGEELDHLVADEGLLLEQQAGQPVERAAVLLEQANVLGGRGVAEASLLLVAHTLRGLLR